MGYSEKNKKIRRPLNSRVRLCANRFFEDMGRCLKTRLSTLPARFFADR